MSASESELRRELAAVTKERDLYLTCLKELQAWYHTDGTTGGAHQTFQRVAEKLKGAK